MTFHPIESVPPTTLDVRVSVSTSRLQVSAMPAVAPPQGRAGGTASTPVRPRPRAEGGRSAGDRGQESSLVSAQPRS